MAGKQIGYDFWNNVLGKPRYVAAPMVDMSELSFRMLCRQHGAQLCFTPMFHSQQFSDDFLYRKDNFSTCKGDRPLIVQFCGNDPEVFVAAASRVSTECEAVDLNLGCPQAIAKKGFYGSFLQDDWDIIRSIVQKASSELPVPVTCKMRILPGHFTKSVEYARMLEHAGCSVLTVHGRTREQKGHATGLASWDVIKEIKASVNIPVIANGNVLSYTDAEACLKYTGADAVMSAEALLNNPALFSGKNPPVWEVVQEYLQLAEKYHTPMRCVRCHLFKILYLCLYQDDALKQILTEGSSLEEFYSIIPLLKKLPEKISLTNAANQEENTDLLNAFSHFEFDACSEDKVLVSNLNKPEAKKNYFPDLNENIVNCNETINSSNGNFSCNSVNDFPVWICHSRPRITENGTTRGCFSKYFEEKSGLDCDVEGKYLSKKQRRRERHHDRVLTSRKDKRKLKKLRRKQKIAEMKKDTISAVGVPDSEKLKSSLTKQQQKMLIRQRLLTAQGTAPKICINLGFASNMNRKEMTQLSSQLRRLYGSNRHSLTPLHVYFCSFSPSDELYQICLVKNDGFSSYVVEMSSDAPEDLFNVEDIIYLSPDSENVLETLEKDKIYVIGGIVDGTVKKDLSLNHAKTRSIQTARLPIVQHLVRYSNNPGTTVLAVNQVFDILLKYHETKDWTESLSSHVPLRKGYCSPQQKHQLQSSIAFKKPPTNSCDTIIEDKSDFLLS